MPEHEYVGQSNNHIQLKWYHCSQCHYEVMASLKVQCPECGCGMNPIAHAGQLPDDRNHD